MSPKSNGPTALYSAQLKQSKQTIDRNLPSINSNSRLKSIVKVGQIDSVQKVGISLIKAGKVPVEVASSLKRKVVPTAPNPAIN